MNRGNLGMPQFVADWYRRRAGYIVSQYLSGLSCKEISDTMEDDDWPQISSARVYQIVRTRDIQGNRRSTRGIRGLRDAVDINAKILRLFHHRKFLGSS